MHTKKGEGSTFWFTLPFGKLKHRRRDSGPAEDGKEPEDVPTCRRILVVDDLAPIRSMLVDMLSLHDHEVMTAANGRKATEYLPKPVVTKDLFDVLRRNPKLDGDPEEPNNGE